MNVRDLLIFQTVAKAGSINKAAEQLNYVQSNVTSRIQKLEGYFQTKLFHRHKRGITLTNEGTALLPYVDKIRSLIDEMKMVASNSSQPEGRLDIASVETVIKLPIILSSYLNEYQQVDLTLSTGVTAELREKVLRYKLDGAFITKQDKVKHTELEEVDVFQEKLVLIASHQTEKFEDLLELPLISFSDGCGYRAKLNEWMQDHQIYPRKVMELGTLETTLGSVISGLGAAYVPYSAIKQYERKKQVRCFELPIQYSHITTTFIYRKSSYLTPALKKFIETIEKTKNNDVFYPTTTEKE